MGEPLQEIREKLLVLRSRSGDEAAFEQLVERYQPRLRYYVRRLLGAPDEEDDLLQDTWLNVWKNLSDLRDPGAFAPWVYCIARNKVYRHIRKNKGFIPLVEGAENVAAREEAHDFSPEEAGQIHECLDKLRPEHREVLLLRFLQEMSYEDIATVIDRSIGTVRSRIHYAKRALRRAIEDANDGK